MGKNAEVLSIDKYMSEFKSFLLESYPRLKRNGLTSIRDDDWDSFSSWAFHFFVSNKLEENGLEIPEYGMFSEQEKTYIEVKVPQGKKIFTGKRSQCHDNNITQCEWSDWHSAQHATKFRFIELAKPFDDHENFDTQLNFVHGISDLGDEVCVKYEDCIFALYN